MRLSILLAAVVLAGCQNAEAPISEKIISFLILGSKISMYLCIDILFIDMLKLIY